MKRFLFLDDFTVVENALLNQAVFYLTGGINRKMISFVNNPIRDGTYSSFYLEWI